MGLGRVDHHEISHERGALEAVAVFNIGHVAFHASDLASAHVVKKPHNIIYLNHNICLRVLIYLFEFREKISSLTN